MINPSLNDSNRRFNVQFHCRVIPEQFCISLVVPMAVIKFNFPIFISFAITKKIIITIIRTFPVPRPNYFIILIKIPIEIVWCDVIVCLISWLLPGCWLLRVDNYGVRNWHVEMQPIVSHCCRFLSLRPLLPQTFLKHSEEKKIAFLHTALWPTDLVGDHSTGSGHTSRLALRQWKRFLSPSYSLLGNTNTNNQRNSFRIRRPSRRSCQINPENPPGNAINN